MGVGNVAQKDVARVRATTTGFKISSRKLLAFCAELLAIRKFAWYNLYKSTKIFELCLVSMTMR
jgi:hypothetical protein